MYSTINDLLLYAVKNHGEKTAVKWKASKSEVAFKTYNDFASDVAKVIGILNKKTAEGAHVAIIGPSSYEWLCAYFATVTSMRVAVPLDVLLPEQGITELLNRADVELLFADIARTDCIMGAMTGAAECNHIISMNGKIENIPCLSDLMEKANPADIPSAWPDSLCTIMYTSGTTGKSKGVMLSHRNMAENATCLDMGIAENSTVLSVLPIHHAYCLSMDILKGISLGSCICINDSLIHMAANVKLFEPDIMLMVPMMIETFGKKIKQVLAKAAADSTLKSQEEILAGINMLRTGVFGKNLHTIYSGGAYLNPEYIDLFAKIGLNLIQGYGMTENAPVISNGYGEHVKRESVGKPLPNCEVAIIDGEIAVKGSSVMMGYYKMPEETAEALHDGYLFTGDLGHMDEDGFLYLTGRKKNLIITPNGENVSPEELENVLGENDLIADILVRESEGVIEAVIYPDAEYANTIGIADIPAKLQEIIDDYNKTIPSYKQIHKLTVRDTEFEKTSTRKIKRY